MQDSAMRPERGLCMQSRQMVCYGRHGVGGDTVSERGSFGFDLIGAMYPFIDDYPLGRKNTCGENMAGRKKCGASLAQHLSASDDERFLLLLIGSLAGTEGFGRLFGVVTFFACLT